jgi:sigma-E factor negative regulatory protein RseA
MDATDKMDNQELISALADGQLRGEAFARAVEAAAGDPRARQAWCSYHLVGEVLRTGSASPCSAPEAFLARLQQRLREEAPLVLPTLAAAQAATVRVETVAANDWRWKLAAGLASFAAVAAVGWNLFGATAPTATQPQLATAAPPNATLAEAAARPLVRDPRLDRLLAAHRQLAGATALGTTSGFLRNATFDGAGR